MKIDEFLKASQHILAKAGIATARLDTLVLMEDVTGKDRSWLLAHPEHDLQIEIVQKLNKLIVQRSRHIPLAYLRHKTEFYGREFYIDKNVLEPRPESETMIELLKSQVQAHKFHVIDVGTGSGALAITAKLELPDCQVSATDIDASCLKVARRNAELRDVKVDFFKSDLLTAIPAASLKTPAIILANLPYVPDDFQINTAALHEPRTAIFGGPDGLDLYRRLFEQARKPKSSPLYIFTESMPPQHMALRDIAANKSYRLETEKDFIQVFRYSA